MRNSMLGAKLVESMPSFDAEPCLERSGRIVEARVDHAAVVRAGVESRARMTLQHARREPFSCDRQRCREAGDARADDGDIDGFDLAHLAPRAGQFVSVTWYNSPLFPRIFSESGWPNAR